MPVYRHASGNGIWYVDYVCPVSGKRRRRSAETTEKQVALEKQRAWVNGLDWKAPPAASKDAVSGEGFTVNEAFDRCMLTVWSPQEASSQRTIKSNCKILAGLEIEIDGKRQRLGTVPVARVTFSVLEAVKMELVKAGYAPGTIKRKMDHLGKALTMCTKWDDSRGAKILTSRPPTPTTRVEKTRERVLTEAEELLVFEAIDAREVRQPTNAWAHYRALVRFLLDTSIRRGEAVQVRASQFTQDEDGDWQVDLLAKQTKNGKPRTVPCTEAVAGLIPWLQASCLPDGRVFPFRGENAWYRWDTIREDVQKAHPEVDLSDVVLHSLRHTCLTRMSNRGVPIEVLCEIAGHHSITITAKYYVHISGSRKKDAVKTLNRPRLVVDNAPAAA